jgi:CheY-like chemotaxis protein
VGRDETVLVVDDDDDVRRSCAAVLRTAGYRVIEASHGLAALAHLRSSGVDAVLLDIFMPGLDGLSVLDQIENPPPVALLTAHVYDDEIVARRSKVAMYIQKPVAPLALLEAVGRMFAGDLASGRFETRPLRRLGIAQTLSSPGVTLAVPETT